MKKIGLKELVEIGLKGDDLSQYGILVMLGALDNTEYLDIVKKYAPKAKNKYLISVYEATIEQLEEKRNAEIRVGGWGININLVRIIIWNVDINQN